MSIISQILEGTIKESPNPEKPEEPKSPLDINKLWVQVAGIAKYLREKVWSRKC